ncbi:SAM-dependent methyltransferase [Streptomyces radicis]|uniref:SAM-dependent methyltransferase n=2 Tax=Streptomyces radicis TaxID=1750517 RepID=A0A3A9W6C8_9ACTN|nr:SAM-dependent methyltransferase [Streptomyces radicis]RKN21919.1 SAM-dependent methyltransferase [Streptomyces radicis]
MRMDWHAWHGDYDDADSYLARRLRIVREWIALTLDVAPPGRLRVVSLCAGQGRDLLGVLPDHPRGSDVTARLVELDPRNVGEARRGVAEAGLGEHVEVVAGDAALTDRYAGMVPADLVLACGIFGNVTDADVERAIGFLPQLCARGGSVIWTRHRREPDLVPRVCRWFEERGFERVWLTEPERGFGVGVHRFTGEPEELAAGARMFTFLT